MNLETIQLIKAYEISCQSLVNTFAEKQDLDFDYWVGGSVGEIAVFSNDLFFSMGEIYYDLSYREPAGLIIEWYYATVEAGSKINYKSYCMGLRGETLEMATDAAQKKAAANGQLSCVFCHNGKYYLTEQKRGPFWSVAKEVYFDAV